MRFTIQRLSALSATVLGLSALGAGLAFATQAGSSDPLDRDHRGPVPLQRSGDAAEAQDTEDWVEPFDWHEWSARLKDQDLDRRLLAFEELVQAARRGEAEREALRAWAEDPTAGELAWTARLALRELERTARQGSPLRQLFDEPGQLLEEPLGELFGGRSFRDLHMHFGDPFAGMEERLRELESQLGRQFDEYLHRRRPPRTAPQPPAPPLPGNQLFGSRSSTSVQIGPDGVRVEISEMRDGEEHTESYSAGSVEELLEQHPELEGRLGLQLRGARRSAPAPPADGPRLGIHIAPVPEERAEELDLEPGVGLLVTGVVPGSIAERLGVRPGDILVELDGRTVRGAEDVRAALEASAGEVRATLINTDGERRTARAGTYSRLGGVRFERF